MPKNLDFESLSSIEGILDVGPLTIAHFSNPIQKDMIQFLSKILSNQLRIIIPYSCFLGAYHILTRYLKVSRFDSKAALMETLMLESPLFFPQIDHLHILTSLDLASIHNIESWDAYLISLAKGFGTRNIYTIDQKLQKVIDINVINPLSDEKMQEYHEWLTTKLQK